MVQKWFHNGIIMVINGP